MGHGLALKAQGEVSLTGNRAQNQVADQGAGEDGHKAQQQLALPEEGHIADAAHHAQAGALGQSAHHKARDQADQDGSMQRAGACARLGEEDEGGSRHQQHQHDHLHRREGCALQHRLFKGAAQRVAPVQEHNTHQNARHETGQPQQRVQIAARQTQNHAEGAAQKHQAADHHKEAQHKAGQRGAAAPGGKFLLGQCHGKAAQHQTNDLRPDVLHCARPVQAQCARGVPQKTGDAEAHVHRVAEEYQRRRNDADDQPRDHDCDLFLFQVHTKRSLTFLFLGNTAQFTPNGSGGVSRPKFP